MTVSTIVSGAKRVRTMELHEIIGPFTVARASAFSASGTPTAIEPTIPAGSPSLASDGTGTPGSVQTTGALRGRRRVRLYNVQSIPLALNGTPSVYFVGFDANVSPTNGIPVYNTADGWLELLISEFVSIYVVTASGTVAGVLHEEGYA